jgi:hypothetical protein
VFSLSPSGLWAALSLGSSQKNVAFFPSVFLILSLGCFARLSFYRIFGRFFYRVFGRFKNAIKTNHGKLFAAAKKYLLTYVIFYLFSWRPLLVFFCAAGLVLINNISVGFLFVATSGVVELR